MEQKNLFEDDDFISITLSDSNESIDLSSTGATSTMISGSYNNSTYTYSNTNPTPLIIGGGGGGGSTTAAYTGGGGSGMYITNQTSPTYTIHQPQWVDTLTNNQLSVRGDAEFDGEITIKGKKLSETLSSIEDKLAIYKPNVELEEKWEELRELSRKYKALEKEIIEKEKMWGILKK